MTVIDPLPTFHFLINPVFHKNAPGKGAIKVPDFLVCKLGSATAMRIDT